MQNPVSVRNIDFKTDHDVRKTKAAMKEAQMQAQLTRTPVDIGSQSDWLKTKRPSASAENQSRGRHRVRQTSPTPPPETDTLVPTQHTHYSKYTVFIHKETFEAYLILDFQKDSGTYEYSVMAEPHWRSVLSSPHTIVFPPSSIPNIGPCGQR
jgi:hypothetical protein